MSSALIVKDNRLVEARGQLTLYESKIVAWCAAQIDRGDDKFKEYELTWTEATRLLGFKQLTLKKIDSILVGLYSKTLKIYDPDRYGDEGWKRVSIIEGDVYNSNKKCFYIKLSEALKPYLLGLKSNFTKLDFVHILRFQCKHTQRIYELCRKELRGNVDANFTRDIDDFKLSLGISNKYKLFTDLKRYVLNPVIKELKNTADLDVKITGHRNHSKSFNMLAFDVKMVKPEKSGYWRQMKSFGIADENISEILSKYGRDIVEACLKKYGSQIGKGCFDNGTLIQSKSGMFISKLAEVAKLEGRQLVF